MNDTILVTFEADCARHDLRYATDAGKINRELGWKRWHSLETGLRETVNWYLEHEPGITEVTSGEYCNWIAKRHAVCGRIDGRGEVTTKTRR